MFVISAGSWLCTQSIGPQSTTDRVSSLYSFICYSINYLLWLWLPAWTERQPTLRALAAGREQLRACLPWLGLASPSLLWWGTFSKSVSLSLSVEWYPPEQSCHTGRLDALTPRTDHWRSCSSLHLFCFQISHIQCITLMTEHLRTLKMYRNLIDFWQSAGPKQAGGVGWGAGTNLGGPGSCSGMIWHKLNPSWYLICNVY